MWSSIGGSDVVYGIGFGDLINLERFLEGMWWEWGQQNNWSDTLGLGGQFLCHCHSARAWLLLEPISFLWKLSWFMWTPPALSHVFRGCLVYMLFPLGGTQYLPCLPASLGGEISYLFLSLGFRDSADRNLAREWVGTFVLKLEAWTAL